MEIFDAHTHIHFPAYDDDREEVINRARSVEVKMITVGTNLETSQGAIVVAEKYPNDIWATVGFHPSHVSSESWYFDKNEMKKPIHESFHIDKLEEIARHPKVVAIGECGLDYYRIKNDELRTKDLQMQVFLQQVELAHELNKTLMIHCRSSKGSDDAYEDLLNVITHNSLFVIPKIIHFFAGSLSVAKKLLELGCNFTFGGAITYGNDYDEVIKFLPLENILLETDAPYVAPVPYRGKRNEPVYVVEVAKKIAFIKNISLEEVARQTTENAKRLFKI